ncbi:hypothetical protein GCM10009759_25430 [Kitasatospora saccharophila]|uniref:Disulfide bond corrector protein DsbC n=1 Tax=Kitasatospora saccharophila TaxID=407973 RepID=A0ABP5IEK5_9ACTN
MLGAATVSALLLGGCGTDRPARPTAQATANGVTVTVTLVPASDGRREVRATFTPQESGFHLYSIDLPAEGVDGLGIPTRLSVRGDLTATGSPSTDREIRRLRPAGLDVELPVYPDGAVTFTLPVRSTGSRQADVVVSYGACSETRCLVPVTDEVIHLDLA